MQRTQPAPLQSRAGFSLIEVVAAVGIMVLMAGVVIPAVGAQMKKSRIGRAKADMATIQRAFNTYHVDTGIWPSNVPFSATTSSQDTFIGFPCLYTNVFSNTGWSGPYLNDGVYISSTQMSVATNNPAQGGLRDPWGNPYRVIYVARTTANPGALFLYSAGPNGAINTSNANLEQGVTTDDDIVSVVTRSY
jgi:type II secretory pathway pseudopilin PulG